MRQGGHDQIKNQIYVKETETWDVAYKETLSMAYSDVLESQSSPFLYIACFYIILVILDSNKVSTLRRVKFLLCLVTNRSCDRASLIGTSNIFGLVTTYLLAHS